jgi:hypothetical protein
MGGAFAKPRRTINRGAVPNRVNGPAYWRSRAEEMRAAAEHVTNTASKDEILRVAESYEQLAKRAEQRQRGES